MKSWIEISAKALCSNVAAIREVAHSAEVLAVIKADGYGHGASDVAPVLQNAGVRWFGVTDAEEGARVRKTIAADAEILVMVGPEAADTQAILQHNLTPTVWTPAHLSALAGVPRVHVEIDTGMSRQGVRPGPELDQLIQTLRSAGSQQLDGVFTHFSESEVANSPQTAEQLRRFAAALEQIDRAGLKPRWIHAANTSAVDESSTLPRVSELARNYGAKTLVRTGFALYGHCLPVEHGVGHLAPRLTPALTWKTRILALRDLAPGDTVGYGATFVAPGPMRLATLPVGYADGFRRAASSGVGNGWVIVRGQRAPVVGRVSMNLITVDVTNIAKAQIGDEATLLGDGVSAEEHAKWSGTIAYDILCGIRAQHISVV